MMELNSFWKVIMNESADGQNILGLIEATCKACDIKYKILRQLTESYKCSSDLVSYALTELRRREIFEKFDAEKAGGEENFAGYVAARVTGILRNELQDCLRAKSITLQGMETPDMLLEGKSYPRYTVASRVGLEIKASCEGEKDVSIVHGDRAKDWCGRCDWEVMEPAAQEVSVFLENLQAELSTDMVIAARHIMREQNGEETGPRPYDKATMARLMVQARKRMARIGISRELLREGALV